MTHEELTALGFTHEVIKDEVSKELFNKYPDLYTYKLSGVVTKSEKIILDRIVLHSEDNKFLRQLWDLEGNVLHSEIITEDFAKKLINIYK